MEVPGHICRAGGPPRRRAAVNMQYFRCPHHGRFANGNSAASSSPPPGTKRQSILPQLSTNSRLFTVRTSLSNLLLF